MNTVIVRLCVMFALAGLGVASAAEGARRAVTLGPEGGAVQWMTVHPGLALVSVNGLGGDGTHADPSDSVWASTDHGLSWRRATAYQRRSLRFLPSDGRVGDPNRSGVRYRYDWDRSGGRIDISTDGGRSWRVLTRSIRDVIEGFVQTLGTRSTTLLLSVPITNGGIEGGIRRSVDGGATWTTSTGITGTVSFIWPDRRRARTVYAASELESGVSALFKSIDAGATWKRVDAGLPFRSSRFIQPTDLLISRSNSAHLLMATNVGISRSINGGVSWQAVRSEPTQVLRADPGRPGVVLAGTAFGVIRSENGGRTWTESNRGLTATTIHSIGVAGDPAHIQLSGIVGRAMLASSVDGGATWTQRTQFPAIAVPLTGAVVLDPLTPSSVMFESTAGLGRSLDDGESWQRVGSRVFGDLTRDQVTREVFATDTGRDVVVASADFGATWDDRGPVPDLAGSFAAVAGHLAVPGRGSVVYRSRDGGRTWSRSATVPIPVLSAVALAPSDPMIMYVGGADAAGHVKIARSRDGGDHWNVVTVRGLGQRGIRALIVGRRDPNRLYWLGFEGVWTSSDAGVSGRRLSSFPRRPTTLEQPRDDPGSLYVGTLNEGLWRYELGG